jgi:hypothetical protein
MTGDRFATLLDRNEIDEPALRTWMRLRWQRIIQARRRVKEGGKLFARLSNRWFVSASLKELQLQFEGVEQVILLILYHSKPLVFATDGGHRPLRTDFSSHSQAHAAKAS